MSKPAVGGDRGWPTVEIGDALSIGSLDEPMGSKRKFWIEREGQTRWLFKFARVDEQGVRGEDWAEYLVHRLASLIDVPTAEVVPATYNGRRGVLSRSVVVDQASETMIHGNELLALLVDGYDKRIARENPRYTVENVKYALDGVEAHCPREFTGRSELDGYDVWAGYLLLDAWVAGRDRHHENWAVVYRPPDVRLAPSFDHGNALGFQVSEEVSARLWRDAAALQKWARRGTSHHFAGRPTLVDAAASALGLASDAAREFWTSRLSRVDFEQVEEIVGGVPAAILSETKAKFVVALLKENRRRLIDGD